MKKRKTDCPLPIRYLLSTEAKAVSAGFEGPRFGDSGYDLRASESITIFQGEQVLVPTGLTLEIPLGYVGMIKDRSSLALRGLFVHAGVIDPSYRGQIQVLLQNQSKANYQVEPGQKIAQLLILKSESLFPPIEVQGIEDMAPSLRGMGAFGSTGE